MKREQVFREEGNLFYIIEGFSINASNPPFFNEFQADIQNIFIVVTGTSISEIDCSLIASKNTATIFLINPNGIIFKSNTFNIGELGGSFLASTASSIIFGDRTQFGVATANTTASVPIGLQFGEQVGTIRVLGASLAVPPGKTLALVGGDLWLEGGNLTATGASSGARNLKAPGGRIELGSVAASSLVNLSATEKGWALGYEGVKDFQDIQLAQFALVDANGDRGGDVRVQGKRITLSDGSQMGAATLGAASGGNLVVTASESVRLVGVDSQKQFYSGLFAVTSGTGDAGNLEIHTEQLTIEDGATISASTIGTGNAGKLTVRAAQVNLNGTSADSKLSSGLFAQVLPGATGKGGNLTIETEQLHVQGGARVATSTFGDGDAGDLTVRASTIDLMGTSADGNLASGLFAEAHQGAKGNTGKLMIQSERLSIKSGAKTSPTTLLECESVEVD